MAIQRIAVIGAGLIGASWTALFIAHGIQTTVYDLHEEAGNDLVTNIQSYLTALAKLERFQGVGARSISWPEVQHLVSFTTDLNAALYEADFVQENAPEVLRLKLDLLESVDRKVKSHTLICSSSSGFRPSDLHGALTGPNRSNFLIGHPFNPPHLIPLVEVVGGPETSPEAVERTMAFYASLGKKPIHVRNEIAGHIANRLQAALFREIFYLLETGAAGVEDIETAMEYGPGLRWGCLGPSLLLHLGGGNGGVADYAARFLPLLMSWFAERHPVVDGRVTGKWIQGTMDVAAARYAGRMEMERERDELLITLLNAKFRADTV